MQKHSKITQNIRHSLTKDFKRTFSMAKKIKIATIHLYTWLQIHNELIYKNKKPHFIPHTTLVVFILHLK